MKSKTVPILLVLSLLLSLMIIPASAATDETCTSIAATGNWSDPATWSGCTGVPDATDNVIIATNTVVTVDANSFANNIDLQNTSTLNGGSAVLEIHGYFHRTGGGVWTPGTGTVYFNGTGIQDLSARAYSFYNVHIGSAAHVVAPVNPTVTNTPIYEVGGSATESETINAGATRTFGFTRTNIALQTAANPIAFTVTRVESPGPNGNSSMLPRFYNIDTGGATTYDLTLCMAFTNAEFTTLNPPNASLNDDMACRFSAGIWSCADNSTSGLPDPEACYAGVTAVGDYWTIGWTTPTAIELQRFTAGEPSNNPWLLAGLLSVALLLGAAAFALRRRQA